MNTSAYLLDELNHGQLSLVEFLNLQLTAAIGLYQMTNLSEVQRIVLEYPEF